MLNILTLYRGQRLGDARAVAVTSDPSIVREFANRLLAEQSHETDPALSAVDQGINRALKEILAECGEEER